MLVFIWLHLGRGVLDTDLYLPQLRIPMSQTSGRPQPRTWKAPPTQNAHYSLIDKRIKRRTRGKSDSEGEDYGSEADRDARLA